jgi:hypothetical protein
MAFLSGIKGIKIQVLATDPTETLEGQLWYNSTSKTFKAVS